MLRWCFTDRRQRMPTPRCSREVRWSWLLRWRCTAPPADHEWNVVVSGGGVVDCDLQVDCAHCNHNLIHSVIAASGETVLPHAERLLLITMTFTASIFMMMPVGRPLRLLLLPIITMVEV